LSFDPWNCSLKFQESTGTPSPKVGVALGVWRFTPSHFLTLPWVCDVTPGLPFGPHPCNPFAFVATPFWGKCENETHTPKSGNLESSRTFAISELDNRGQNTLPWGDLYTVGKILKRATSLLETSSQSKVWAGSYEFPKSRESKLGQFRDSSLGVLVIKAIGMRVPRSNAENIIWGKVVASPESGPWWVKWVQGYPWLVPTPKVCRMSSNQLVGWFGCRTE